MKTAITVTAVWLRRIGDRVQVLVEGERGWVLAIEEHADAPFSHIAEGNGAYRWPLDPVTDAPVESGAKPWKENEPHGPVGERFMRHHYGAKR